MNFSSTFCCIVKDFIFSSFPNNNNDNDDREIINQAYD